MVCMMIKRPAPVTRFRFIYVIIMRQLLLYIKKAIIFLGLILLIGSANHETHAISVNHHSGPVIGNQCVYLEELDTLIISIKNRPSVIVSSDKCNLLKSRDIALVIDVFHKRYKDKFGDDGRLLRALQDMAIHLSSKPKKVKNLYSNSGKPVDESYVNGLFFVPNHVWLHVVPGSSVEDTALVHELVHYALHVTLGQADPDHEGDVYKAWTKEHTKFLSTTNYEIRELMSKKRPI